MKKIVSIILVVIGFSFFGYYYSYVSNQFDYGTSQIIWNFCQWILCLVIISLFAFVLPEKKYKTWFFISIPVVLISLYWAYMVGDGNGAILSFDGEIITWFCVGIYSIVSFIFVLVSFLQNKKTI